MSYICVNIIYIYVYITDSRKQLRMLSTFIFLSYGNGSYQICQCRTNLLLSLLSFVEFLPFFTTEIAKRWDLFPYSGSGGERMYLFFMLQIFIVKLVFSLTLIMIPLLFPDNILQLLLESDINSIHAHTHTHHIRAHEFLAFCDHTLFLIRQFLYTWLPILYTSYVL